MAANLGAGYAGAPVGSRCWAAAWSTPMSCSQWIRPVEGVRVRLRDGSGADGHGSPWDQRHSSFRRQRPPVPESVPMKVPLRWLQEFIELPTTDPVQLSNVLTMLGHEVENFDLIEPGGRMSSSARSSRSHLIPMPTRSGCARWRPDPVLNRSSVVHGISRRRLMSRWRSPGRPSRRLRNWPAHHQGCGVERDDLLRAKPAWVRTTRGSSSWTASRCPFPIRRAGRASRRRIRPRHHQQPPRCDVARRDRPGPRCSYEIQYRVPDRPLQTVSGSPGDQRRNRRSLRLSPVHRQGDPWGRGGQLSAGCVKGSERPACVQSPTSST